MKNDTIAEVIALLNTASYDTDTLNQKRDEVVSTLKEQLSIQRVSKSLPERKGRCCGRCDGVHDLCFSDMTCDVHNVLGCEDCYGKR